MRINKSLLYFYGGLSGTLYGLIWAGQVLGFWGIYRPANVIIVSILVSVGITWLYFRGGNQAFFDELAPEEDGGGEGRWFDKLFYLSGGLLFSLLIITPLVRWPYSYITRQLPWDSGVYHFPKAIELFRTGTVWDLSIPYGQYPFGLESLLSGGIVITGDEALFGTIHAIIGIYVFLTVWLLSRRYTNLPGGLLFLGASGLMILGRLWAGSNLGLFTKLLYFIGKNDLFLGALLLGAILHTPIGRKHKRNEYHLMALAMATMMAFSVKPNSIYVIVALWSFTFYSMWKSAKDAGGRNSTAWKNLIVSGIIILPGGLWMVRNLIVIGTVLTPPVLELNTTSIANNLTNPFFYEYIPLTLWGIIGVGVVIIIASFRLKRPSWTISTTFLLLLASFALSPASAFHILDTEIPARVGWRFAVALVGFSYLAMMALFDPLIKKIYRWIIDSRGLQIVGVIGLILGTGWIVWNNRDLLEAHQFNSIVLEDQFPEPVGVDGYYSAYDFVHQNLEGETIRVENGLAYYVYGPGFKNTPTKLQYPLGMESAVPQLEPKYFLIFKTSWWGGEGSYEDYVETESFLEKWKIIYEDQEGRLYQRKGWNRLN